MRRVQLTLAENDPGRFDVQFWLDYLKRIHVDLASFSAGGYVAYYPTRVPLHFRSRWLGDSDPFGDLVHGCRAMGMMVMARTDPHAVHQDVCDAHPDWIAVDAEGRRRQHWVHPEAWVTCALGPYNFEFMTEVHKEIVALYGVDAVFSNRWTGSGLCYCEHCQRLFREATGHDLPRTDDIRDDAFRAYRAWREGRLFELAQLWDRELQGLRPGTRFIPNSGGGAFSDLNMVRLAEMVPFLCADRQGRTGVMAPWANGKNAKEFRATMRMKPVEGICNVGVTDRYRWKDSVKSEAEFRIWMAEAIANGMRPRFSKFCGTLYDHRWLDMVARLYEWHFQSERYLRNEANLARVAVVYSQQTATYYGGSDARQMVEDPILGWYQALVEARIPFEMVHDGYLDASHLAPFRTLILPNIACLSDVQCAQLREFVARGGSLVATYETSLYDDQGEQRQSFGLADLFGVDWRDHQGPMQNAYINLEHRDGASPLLVGLEQAQRIVHGAYRLCVVPREDLGPAQMTLVPPYPDLPMEEVYPREPHTDIPEVYTRSVGKGRVVYFPWDIDRIFWDVLNVDHGKLMANAVAWATDEPPVAEVTGPGVVDVAVWRQRESLTVCLVNLTNPMMMKGPFRELLPVSEQRVRVRLPQGARVRKARLLRAGRTVEWEERDGYLIASVPRILDLEILAVDL